MYSSGACSLTIRGNNLPLEMISKTLNLEPTELVKKGEVVSPVFGPCNDDVWIHMEWWRSGEEISETLERLINLVYNNREFVEEMTNALDVRMRIYIQSEYAQVGFELPSTIINRLANLGIPMEVSIFSWGGADTAEECC